MQGRLSWAGPSDVSLTSLRMAMSICEISACSDPLCPGYSDSVRAVGGSSHHAASRANSLLVPRLHRGRAEIEGQVMHRLLPLFGVQASEYSVVSNEPNSNARARI